VVAQGWGKGSWIEKAVMFNGVSFWGDKNVLKLILMIIAQL
jgi:hypothetical protein